LWTATLQARDVGLSPHLVFMVPQLGKTSLMVQRGE
jgi:hypothetical protein